MKIEIINCLNKDYHKVFKEIAKKLSKGFVCGGDRVVIYKGKKNIYNPEYYFGV